MRKLALTAMMFLAFIMAGCVSEQDRRHEAEQLGRINLDLSQMRFGYWRQQLAALSIETENCYDSPNIHVTNCQESRWGKTWLVRGRFMTLPGNEAGVIVGPTATDTDSLLWLKINIDYLNGTFCGDAVDRVRASGLACGQRVTIDGGTLTVTNGAIR